MGAGTGISSRKGVRALLVSLAVHALLVLLLLRRAPAPPAAPRPPEVLEVELAEAPPPPTPTLVEPPLPPPSAAPEPRPRRASAPDRSASATAPAPPAAPTPAPSAPAEEPSMLRMRTPNLALDPATIDRFTHDGVISAAPAPPAPEPRGPSKWQQKLAMVEREVAGRRNVEEGKVHPQIFDFMRDAQQSFAPRESVVEKDPRAPNTVGRTMQSWTKGFFRNYLDKLRRLERDEPAHRSPMAEGGSDILAEYGRLLRAAEKGGEAIACQVCLVLRPGLPPEVVLAKSSNNREIDQAAIDALTRASLRKPMEKDVQPERACYRFAATLYRIPPLPIVGCGFDESTLKVGCYYPGMQVYQLKVSLDLVDYSGG
jgi:hypothetical protein